MSENIGNIASSKLIDRLNTLITSQECQLNVYLELAAFNTSLPLVGCGIVPFPGMDATVKACYACSSGAAALFVFPGHGLLRELVLHPVMSTAGMPGGGVLNRGH